MDDVGGLGADKYTLIRCMGLRATSHTRLRARDHCTSNILMGRTSRMGPSCA